MNNLPIELVDTVADNVVDTSDLCSFRSVSAVCHDLVTPKLFRQLHVRNAVKSAQHCQRILLSQSLAPLVRELVFDDADYDTFDLVPLRSDENIDELEIADLEENLTELFCQIPSFSNLQHLKLNFWPIYLSSSGCKVRDHPFWFSNRQLSVLHAIHHAMQTSRVTSLSLHNVVLAPSHNYDFVSSVKNSPLSHLSISVVANRELGGWSGTKSQNGAIGALLPRSNSALRSLSIRSPRGSYFSPTMQLASLHYPNLESLVLENIVFDYHSAPDGIEEFIMRHKDSLSRLELHSCSSYVAPDIVEKRYWSSIWERLGAELSGLSELIVTGAPLGYTQLDPVHGDTPHVVMNNARGEEDMQALQELQDSIKTRNAQMQGSHSGSA